MNYSALAFSQKMSQSQQPLDYSNRAVRIRPDRDPRLLLRKESSEKCYHNFSDRGTHLLEVSETIVEQRRQCSPQQRSTIPTKSELINLSNTSCDTTRKADETSVANKEGILNSIIGLLHASENRVQFYPQASTSEWIETPQKYSEIGPTVGHSTGLQPTSMDILTRLHAVVREAYTQAQHDKELTKALSSILSCSNVEQEESATASCAGRIKRKLRGEFDCKPFQGPKTPPTPHSREKRRHGLSNHEVRDQSVWAEQERCPPKRRHHCGESTNCYMIDRNEFAHSVTHKEARGHHHMEEGHAEERLISRIREQRDREHQDRDRRKRYDVDRKRKLSEEMGVIHCVCSQARCAMKRERTPEYRRHGSYIHKRSKHSPIRDYHKRQHSSVSRTEGRTGSYQRRHKHDRSRSPEMATPSPLRGSRRGSLRYREHRRPQDDSVRRSTLIEHVMDTTNEKAVPHFSKARERYGRRVIKSNYYTGPPSPRTVARSYATAPFYKETPESPSKEPTNQDDASTLCVEAIRKLLLTGIDPTADNLREWCTLSNWMAICQREQRKFSTQAGEHVKVNSTNKGGDALQEQWPDSTQSKPNNNERSSVQSSPVLQATFSPSINRGMTSSSRTPTSSGSSTSNGTNCSDCSCSSSSNSSSSSSPSSEGGRSRSPTPKDIVIQPDSIPPERVEHIFNSNPDLVDVAQAIDESVIESFNQESGAMTELVNCCQQTAVSSNEGQSKQDPHLCKSVNQIIHQEGSDILTVKPVELHPDHQDQTATLNQPPVLPEDVFLSVTDMQQTKPETLANLETPSSQFKFTDCDYTYSMEDMTSEHVHMGVNVGENPMKIPSTVQTNQPVIEIEGSAEEGEVVSDCASDVDDSVRSAKQMKVVRESKRGSERHENTNNGKPSIKASQLRLKSVHKSPDSYNSSKQDDRSRETRSKREVGTHDRSESRRIKSVANRVSNRNRISPNSVSQRPRTHQQNVYREALERNSVPRLGRNPIRSRDEGRVKSTDRRNFLLPRPTIQRGRPRQRLFHLQDHHSTARDIHPHRNSSRRMSSGNCGSAPAASYRSCRLRRSYDFRDRIPSRTHH